MSRSVTRPDDPVEPSSSDGVTATAADGVDLDRLRDVLIEVSLAVQDRYDEREPTDAEVAAFVRERLLAEGRSEEEIAAILGEADGGDPA